MQTAQVRPMTFDDVPGVTAVVDAANADDDRRAGRPPETRTDRERAAFERGMRRFVERDPAGAWVADDDGVVVGMAEAVRRDSFWGLAMLFVDPSWQSRGVGRRLLQAAHRYADGATVQMIMTSSDARALRRYSALGLAIHPAVEAEGTVDRSTLPFGLPGRTGDAGDLDLVADVDAGLRGSRAEDVEFVLSGGAGIEVVDSGPGRGYAVHRANRLTMLGATDDTTAAQLMWRVLAQVSDEKTSVWGLTAGQDWAVRVALAARLSVVPGGPLFVGGRDQPPGPWVPSGWYF